MEPPDPRDASPLRADPAGALLHVRLTPKGGRDAIDGLGQDAAGRAFLAARVSAPPDKGAANAALLRLIAQNLDLRARDIELIAGASARLKVFRLSGNADALAARLDAVLAAL